MRKARVLSLLAAIAVMAPAPSALAARFEEEVISFSTHDGLELEGIVSFPAAGSSPFPAMLLIHGSGLHDADLTIDLPDYGITNGKQRLFRILARFLSRRGMTVLRYNKRGASFEHENDQPDLLINSTLKDLVRDAESAYQALASHPMADHTRMAVYGHSEGSIVAPRVVRRVGNAGLLVLVGSVSSKFEFILRFQSFEIHRMFFELAADANGDGVVTLEELDRLDGNSGLGSVWVGNLAPVLFTQQGTTVIGFSPDIDRDGDGRLQISDELLPVLEVISQNNLDAWRSGAAAGRYGQSFFEMKPNHRVVPKVRIPILLCQGELDVQTPLTETLDLITVLEEKNRDYEALLFPKLGHSLSKPNNFFKEDGGLTMLDNPTLNVMKKKTMKRILKRIKAHLR